MSSQKWTEKLCFLPQKHALPQINFLPANHKKIFCDLLVKNIQKKCERKKRKSRNLNLVDQQLFSSTFPQVKS